MRSMSKIEVSVTLGEGTVVIRRSGYSHPEIARILGVERNKNGEITTAWLDKLVHRIGESEFTGWNVSGAISTVLHRAASALDGCTVKTVL